MSYISPEEDSRYNQKNTYIKRTLKREINNEKEKKDYDQNNEENLSDVLKAFKYFETNNNGEINISELKKVLSTFGDTMSEDEISKIFMSAGIERNNNENIDYIQFVDFWLRNN